MVRRKTLWEWCEAYVCPDDFVDDSELAWEQQAAASQDGFFGLSATHSL